MKHAPPKWCVVPLVCCQLVAIRKEMVVVVAVMSGGVPLGMGPMWGWNQTRIAPPTL